MECTTLGRQEARKQASVMAGGTTTVDFSLEAAPLHFG